MGGNSGSPVIRIVDGRVIGLHHAGDNRTGFNLAIPMRRILENSDVLVASLSPNSSNAEAELAALRKKIEEMQNKEAPAPTAGPSEDEAEIERLRKELEDMRTKAEMEALRKKLEEMQAESDARNAEIVAAPISPSRTPSIQNESLSCHDLWYQRNLIYDRAGYCFKTAKGQRYFSNAGCNGGIPSGSRLAEAKRIKALEDRRGC
jgi:hypothetical protein